ncbi:unnamed protein product [Phaedon cochleariae]|uniref:Ig-like domain-containing protein n=1 Tax=Phaedon cochleariae TaxID=80249 RepID=A0A9P0DLP4_PHACE|nr:unnamed protein product [Phaedon cochleariae]
MSEVLFSRFTLLRQVWILIVVSSPIMSGYNGDLLDHKQNINLDLNSGPTFDDIMTREVHATEGQTLLLPCTVKRLNNKVVSWMRSKDLHILTSGRHTFSSDRRFESVHTDSSGDFWGLRIRGVHLSDTGQYECQVNTEPKMSLAIGLRVTGDHKSDLSNSKWVSQALIKGPSRVYVQNGSLVTFTCEISPLSQQSGVHGLFFATKPSVRWLHDGKEVSFEFTKENFTVETEYQERDQRIFSRIRLPAVSWKESGQYTCMQPSVKPDNVMLIVVEGEHSEAMQRDFPATSTGSISTYIPYMVIIFSVLI